MTTTAPRLAAVCVFAVALGCERRGELPDPIPIDEVLPAGPRVPVAISAGGAHACALMNDGTVFCWGDNADREIGDGGTREAKAPKRVRHIAGALEVAAGWGHNCVRGKDGTVECWGANVHGQLGVSGIHSTPQTVVNLHDVEDITAAGDTTCALRSDGAVFCWGANSIGELGNGAQLPSAEPVPVSLPEVTAITSWGSGVCATAVDQSVYCWGRLMGEPLDAPGAAYSTVPIQVQDLYQAAQLAIGYDHACALWTDGTAGCFGENDYGQLGDGTTAFQPHPTPVQGLDGLKGLSLGLKHSCAWDMEGRTWCWGWDGWDALGTPETQDQVLPVVVPGLSDIVQVAAGNTFVCALRKDRAVYCWGSDALGDGSSFNSLTPVRVAFGCEGQDGDGICPLVRCQRELAGTSYDDCYRTVFSSDDGCRCVTEDDCQQLDEEEWIPLSYCDEPPYSNGT
jgi:hypothetical protein